jgi:winged helix DNA-binding protein
LGIDVSYDRRVSERTLTRRELNRALLARQLLLERATLSLPRAVERIGGIQDQYAPNAYLRLWSCLEGFERHALDRALVRRSVVQGTLMRGTIHVVSRSDYPLFAAGIRRAGQEWWRRVNKVPADLDMEPFAERARAFFAGTTRTHAEVDEFLRANDFPRASPWGFTHWVDLVRVPPAGTWDKRRAHTFALAEEWVGPLDATEEDGLAHLVRRYLAAFGPAPPADVAKWAGVKPGLLAGVLERVTLRRFRDEDGTELLDLPRAPLPDPDTPAPVRFLPTWDAALLVHARRTGILAEEYRPVIFATTIPPSIPTFLVDGAVAGTWRHEGGRIELSPFTKLDRAVLRELREEAERLAAFHA